MDSLKQILSDVHVFLYGGLSVLPLTIAGTMLILGLGTANYAMLFFLIGFLILAPLGASILDILFKWLPDSWISAMTSDICNVNIPFTTLQNPTGKGGLEPVISTPWMAMITFFLGYVLHNSIQLYTRQTTDPSLTVTPDSSDQKVVNRTSQAMLSMISIVIMGIVILAFRYKTGCESAIGMALTTAAFTSAGYFWYDLLSKVGQDRLSDLFGIANRLLAPSAFRSGPIACLPDPSEACDAQGHE